MDKLELQQDSTLTEESAEDETTLKDAETQETENSESQETSDDPNSETTDASKESEKTDEEDEGIKRIKKLNNENKSLRTRLREAEDQLKSLGTDPDSFKTLVSERDNYKTQYDSLLASLRTERLSSSITEVARKNGAIEPDAVIALANTTDVKVEYDNDNRPTNVDAVVKNLKTKYPKLFMGASSNGNAGARNEREANLDAMTPEQRIAAGLRDRS